MQVGGVNIEKISGPVTCYYLKPKYDKFLEFHMNDIDLPLLLLFGDMHGSSQRMCSSCIKKYGCYKIYDKELLILLDSLSSDTNPVDFYTETFMDYNYQRFYNIALPESPDSKIDTPMNKLIYGDIEICFKRDKRGTIEYETKCPTKNIRWHYSDPRLYYKYIEGNIYLLSMYLDYIDTYVKYDYEKNVRYTKDKLYISLSYFKNVLFIDDIKYILRNIDDIDDVLDNPNSIVRKQISKHKKFLGDINWKELYIHSISIKNLYDNIIDIDNLISNIDDLSYLIEYRISYPESFEMFILVIKEILTKLLDIYFITRFLKGNFKTQPSLVVSYLGVFHIENIVDILVNKLKLYDIEYKLGEIGSLKYPNRCLQFIGGVYDNINLDKDVYYHNMNRLRDVGHNLFFRHKK